MEALIFIAILALVGYLIYQNSPSSKFAKANELFNQTKYSEAIVIYESLFGKIPQAPAKLAECKLKQALNPSLLKKDAVTSLQFILDLKKTLPPNADIALFEKVEATAGLELARMLFETAQQKGKAIPEEGIKLLSTNIEHINKLCKTSLESDYKNLLQKHHDSLALLHFACGVEAEKKDIFDHAIIHYNKIIQHLNNDLQATANAEARIVICELKKAEHRGSISTIDVRIFEKVKAASTDIRNDLYFRYLVLLIKNEKIDEAETIIRQHFNEHKSAEVNKINEVLHAHKLKKAIEKIHRINQELEQLYNDDFPFERIKEFYSQLDSSIKLLIPLLPEYSRKLAAIQPSIFNRLLWSYMESSDFLEAILLICKFPSFWRKPELLKNLAICCFKAISSSLDEKNYQLIISCWTTSIYSDGVLVKSLENTSWDDPYTFTLREAIGPSALLDVELPENVNYDHVSDTNISIGKAQKELMHYFELELNTKIVDEKLLQLANQFYKDEKESIENLISVIHDDIFLATPFFAKFFSINSPILEALDSNFYKDENEEVLLYGLPYLKTNSGGYVKQYSEAVETVKRLVQAIKKRSLRDFSSTATESAKAAFSKFVELKSAIEDELFNAITVIAEKSHTDEEIIPIMEQAINFSPTTQKLKYLHSNYVSSLCVTKVNAKEMTNLKALTLMKAAYFNAPDSSKICKNIISLIDMNLMDILNDKSTNIETIYKILDDIHQSRSSQFISAAKELNDTRNALLNQLSKSGVDITMLVDEPRSAFDLLADFTKPRLSSQGEKMKRALSYMKKLSDKTIVNNPFSKIEPLRF